MARERSAEFKLDFLDSPEPNQFVGHVSWPKEMASVDVKLGNGYPVTENRKSFYQFAAKGGQPYTIHLNVSSTHGAPIWAKTLKATAPRDFVVGSVVNVTAPLELTGHRLFFLAGGKILARPYPITLTFNEIRIEAKNYTGPISTANIQTGSEDEVATRGNVHELKGAAVVIRAKKIIGRLHVAMIGQNGWSGRSGNEMYVAAGNVRKPDPSKRGDPGRDGAGRMGDPPRPGTEGPMTDSACQTPPTAGGKGRQGDKGWNGEDGGAAGLPGTFILDVEDDSQLEQLEVGYRYGKPGKGGVAGAGLDGGPGGPAGADAPGCPTAQPGPQGDDGPPGLPGNTPAYPKQEFEPQFPKAKPRIIRKIQV